MDGETRPGTRWAKWQENFGLLNAPIAAAVVAGLLAILFARFGIALKPSHMTAAFAGTVTFLSLIMAAGFVQYGYFFEMRYTEVQRIRRGEYDPYIQRLRQQIVDAWEAGRKDPAFEEWRRECEKVIEDRIARVIGGLRAFNVPLFRNALSVLFAVGAALFVAAVAELAWLIVPIDDVRGLRIAAADGLATALLIFGVMWVRYLLIVRRELIRFEDY